MRRNLIPTILLMMALLYYSCYPDEPSYNTPPVYDVIVVGNGNSNIMDSVVTLEVIDSQVNKEEFIFSMITGNPANNEVTCYLSGLPAGVTATPDSVAAKLPRGLQTNINVNTDTGFFTFYVNEYSAVLGLHSYPVRLHVLPALDCTPDLEGTWISKNNCGNDSCAVTVTAVPGMLHWASIQNIACLGDSIIAYAYISCKNGIYIPLQTSNGYTMHGGINIDMATKDIFISIPDTITHNGTTEVCILHLEKP